MHGHRVQVPFRAASAARAAEAGGLAGQPMGKRECREPLGALQGGSSAGQPDKGETDTNPSFSAAI